MKESLQIVGISIFRLCKRCGEVFEVKRSYASCTKYCPGCRRAAYREKARKRRHGLLAAIRDESRAKARERTRFFATRDRAFERAGLPKPTITKTSDGVLIERRGRCGGTAAGAIDTSVNRAMAFI